MDDRSEKGSESEDIGSFSKTSDSVSSGESGAKTCADCGTTKTPLWRGGPAGPKSLCNACGIRSRKKRRALLGLNKGGVVAEDKKSTKKINSRGEKGSKSKFGDSLKRKLMALGREVVVQRSAAMAGKQQQQHQHQRKKMGEEEQAAVLLMALSCGSLYA